MLQLAAAAGAEMRGTAPARAGLRRASRAARRRSPRRAAPPAAPASARPAAPAARTPASRRAWPMPSPARRSRSIAISIRSPGARPSPLAPLGLQPAAGSRRSPVARVDHGQELQARGVAPSSSQRPPSTTTCSIRPPAAGRASSGRPTHRIAAGARSTISTTSRTVPADQRDAAGDHKGLEQARDVVHLVRR